LVSLLKRLEHKASSSLMIISLKHNENKLQSILSKETDLKKSHKNDLRVAELNMKSDGSIVLLTGVIIDQIQPRQPSHLR